MLEIPRVAVVGDRLAEGVRVLAQRDVVENFSIAPSVLDYASVERPPEMQASSLRPILEGKREAADGALCEYINNDRSRAGTCVWTERYKYGTWGCRYTGELYDLQEDPGEMRNLWDDPGYAGVCADDQGTGPQGRREADGGGGRGV